MATTKISGITIQIGGDTSGLSKSLKSVNESIRNTQSELKQVERLLKLDPTNTELLAKKQELLERNASLAANKLDALKRADAGLNQELKEGNITTQQYAESHEVLTRAITEQTAVTNNAIKKSEEYSSALAKVGESARAAAEKAEAVYNSTKLLSAGAGLGLGAMVKEAVDFESAFIGVQKTVEATPEQFEKMREEIVALSKELPFSTEEISSIAEAAGQLGIAQEDVINFSEVMLKLGETTNLSADEAATAFARFANITGTAADDYSRLGSVVVALGNNFATTESEITHLSQRLASAGTLAGLTEPEIMALATAMTSVGIEAEAGGTAMTQTMTAIEKAVADGGDSLSQFAQIAGMSSSEFAKLWETNAVGALQSFIGGLGSLEEKGESATLVLDEMGLSGVRQSNMLRSLALASDLLGESVDLANQAWEENIALDEEARKRNEATESKLKILKNTASALASELGENLLPIVQKGVDSLSSAVNWFSNLSEGGQNAILVILGLVAAIAPLAKGIAGLSKAVAFFSSGAGVGFVGVIKGAVTAIGGLISSIGLAPIAIAAAAAAVIALVVKNWDAIKEWLVTAYENVSEWLSTVWTALNDWLSGIYEKAASWISQTWDKISGFFNRIISFLRDTFTATWQGLWENVGNILKTLWDGFVDIVKAPANGILRIINGIIDGINRMIAGLNSIQIDIPDWVPGLGGKVFGFNIPSIKNIPYLANGGILSSGSAIVGEAGPELLTMLGTKAMVQPLTGANAKAAINVTMNNTFNGYDSAAGQSIARDLVRQIDRALGRAY